LSAKAKIETNPALREDSKDARINTQWKAVTDIEGQRHAFEITAYHWGFIREKALLAFKHLFSALLI
jgi:hypothetical protein